VLSVIYWANQSITVASKDHKMHTQGTAGKKEHVTLIHQKPEIMKSVKEALSSMWSIYNMHRMAINWECEGPFQVTDIERDYISATGHGVVQVVYRNLFVRKISDWDCDTWKMWQPEAGLTLGIRLPNYTSDPRLCSSACCFCQCSLMGCSLLFIFEGLQQIIVF